MGIHFYLRPKVCKGRQRVHAIDIFFLAKFNFHRNPKNLLTNQCILGWELVQPVNLVCTVSEPGYEAFSWDSSNQT